MKLLVLGWGAVLVGVPQLKFEIGPTVTCKKIDFGQIASNASQRSSRCYLVAENGAK